MAVGAFSRGRTADPFGLLFANGGVATTFAMNALNNGWAARHEARSALKPKGFWINGSAVSAPPTMTGRIETLDSNEKPSGTLYDANATKTFTLVTGWQQINFDTLPTTARSPGTGYALVLLSNGNGTTNTIRSAIGVNGFPTAVLTASDGSTRSNFAVVSASTPMCALVLEDDSIVAEGMCPYAVGGTTQQIYGTRAIGIKFPLASPAVVDGIDVGTLGITGTPTNLVAKIYSGSSAVSGAIKTARFQSIQNTTSTRQMRLQFEGGPVALAAGTYRAVIHQSDTTTASTNRFNLSTAVAVSADLLPAGVQLTTTLDVTAGSITWTDTPTETPAGFGLIFSDLPAGGGGVQMPIIINL
ncbi:hypothetical protein VT84_14140 [Gemmata sp. SH-PL17]|uniref:hypothetical protein n=1 Tax=Gemmata sp. SH-PL17 TaxID=1630693 RepID=UPI00078CEEB1|nr:hypothetical protein [Gemmata sp. SH-PL17]AMV25534.1 hypothetical protein VT84_14140 [Gemmata sp. SH-PL17]